MTIAVCLRCGVRKSELWDEGAWTARRDELLGDVGSLLRDPSPALQNLVL